MIYASMLVLHLIGFSMLVTGVMLGLRMLRVDSAPAELLRVVRRYYINLGIGIVSGSGIVMIDQRGYPGLFSLPWIHVKLAAALILVGCAAYTSHLIAVNERSRHPLPRRTVALIHSAVGAMFLITLIAVIFGQRGYFFM